MKRESLLAVPALAFLLMQACQNPNNKANEMQSAVIDSVIKEEIITDTSGINRGAGIVEFMKAASIAGMMEIELAKLAEQKATHPKIQKYAAMIVKDHTKIAERLNTLAADKRIVLPTTLPASDQQHLAELQKMPVSDFEKHYIEMMVKDHIKTLDLFKSATTSGDTPAQDFAISALRKLEAHYKAAIAIKHRMH